MPDEDYKLDMTKKPRSAPVKLADVRIDGGTQQRPLNPDAVQDYTERYEEGSDGPPVQIVQDTEGNEWMWDGFHRYHAAKAAGRTELQAAIRKGTQRDAVWLSYAANRGHGVRREPGVVKAIVEKVLSDPEYAKRSAKDIAEHVGTSARYVEHIKAALRDEAKRRASSEQHGGSNGNGKAAPPEAAVREVTRGGQTYTMNVGKMAGKRNGQAESLQPSVNGEGEALAYEDKEGNKLTDPDHQRIFARTPELRAKVKAIDELRVALQSAIDQRDPLYRFVYAKGTLGDLENAAGELKASYPHALCPTHPDDKLARKDCKWCHGAGWLSRGKYKLAKAAMAGGKDVQEAAPAAAVK